VLRYNCALRRLSGSIGEKSATLEALNCHFEMEFKTPLCVGLLLETQQTLRQKAVKKSEVIMMKLTYLLMFSLALVWCDEGDDEVRCDHKLCVKNLTRDRKCKNYLGEF
jgi:hypothetical protein